jgi:hypothetical protein
MGQSVTVIAKPSTNPGVLRFEINRSLTGMGHERYSSLDDVVRDRPVDVLARRILEHGGIDSVHVNSSIITVRLAGGSTGAGLQEIIEDLFRFYPDGGEVSPGDDPASEDAAVAATAD